MNGRDAGDADGESDRAGCVNDAPTRLMMSVALPCGIGGCGRAAREALAEPDPSCPGTWVLLPICPACAADIDLQARAPGNGEGIKSITSSESNESTR